MNRLTASGLASLVAYEGARAQRCDGVKLFITNSIENPTAELGSARDGAKGYFYVLFIQQRITAQRNSDR